MKFISEDKKVNFIEGIITMGGAGGPVMKVSYVIFYLFIRTASLYWSTLVTLTWREKPSTRLTEIC